MAKSFYQVSLKALIKNKKGEVLIFKAEVKDFIFS